MSTSISENIEPSEKSSIYQHSTSVLENSPAPPTAIPDTPSKTKHNQIVSTDSAAPPTPQSYDSTAFTVEKKKGPIRRDVKQLSLASRTSKRIADKRKEKSEAISRSRDEAAFRNREVSFDLARINLVSEMDD